MAFFNRIWDCGSQRIDLGPRVIIRSADLGLLTLHVLSRGYDTCRTGVREAVPFAGQIGLSLLAASVGAAAARTMDSEIGGSFARGVMAVQAASVITSAGERFTELFGKAVGAKVIFRPEVASILTRSSGIAVAAHISLARTSETISQASAETIGAIAAFGTVVYAAFHSNLLVKSHRVCLISGGVSMLFIGGKAWGELGRVLGDKAAAVGMGVLGMFTTGALAIRSLGFLDWCAES